MLILPYNREIVIIDQKSLEAVIGELYGEDGAKQFQKQFSDLDKLEASKAFNQKMITFVTDLALKLAIDLIPGRLGFYNP